MMSKSSLHCDIRGLFSIEYPKSFVKTLILKERKIDIITNNFKVTYFFVTPRVKGKVRENSTIVPLSRDSLCCLMKRHSSSLFINVDGLFFSKLFSPLFVFSNSESL